MKIRFSLMFYFTVIILFFACHPQPQKTFPGQTYQFDLKQLAKTCTLSNAWVKCDAFDEKVLSVTTADGYSELMLTATSDGIDWASAQYLVCEVWHDNPHSVLMNLQFFRKTGDESVVAKQGDEAVKDEAGPRISCVIGILPHLKTNMVFPLSHLDGQAIFLTRQPRQLKGTVTGRRIDPEDVGKVSIQLMPDMAPDYLATIHIASAYLTTELPAPFEKPAVAVVDAFGQWTARDWPGKVHSHDELKATLAKTEAMAASATPPDDWSAYGGWKQLRFEPKGFFYTHHDGRRWWLVDPDGYAFISAGIDCITTGEGGKLSGHEDLFEWLPPQDDSLFAQAYQLGRNPVMIDFMRINMMRVNGAAWKKKWEETTVGLLKRWRVNTVANWSDYDVGRRHKIPYVINMSRFPTTSLKLFRDFPDVFDPAYGEAAVQFAKQLNNVKDDPCLIGYFLQNEPHWAFGDNNVAFEMFATATPSYTKKEMISWLQKKYGTIQAFNSVWKQDLPDFNAIESFTMKDSPSDAAWDDCTEFSGVMVDRYVEAACNEVKKVDPNHLNLGMRYAWISSELCYRAGAWFDVFSINGYTNPDPPSTEEVTRRSGKPVLIGEWQFGATDRGHPATGIQGAESQQARGEAYRYYFEQGIARPELIGIHWFQWNDQPVIGRADGENYNIGFVDICMQPYQELTAGAQLAHERMYRVAAGLEKPFDKVIRKIPQIFY